MAKRAFSLLCHPYSISMLGSTACSSLFMQTGK
jgi:hypothetical protein